MLIFAKIKNFCESSALLYKKNIFHLVVYKDQIVKIVGVVNIS
nr:hypothetical protein B11C_10003 [Bartonella sp. 1-1C]